MWYIYSTLMRQHIGITVAFHPDTRFMIYPIFCTSCELEIAGRFREQITQLV